jgi:hypothetical protein
VAFRAPAVLPFFFPAVVRLMYALPSWRDETTVISECPEKLTRYPRCVRHGSKSFESWLASSGWLADGLNDFLRIHRCLSTFGFRACVTKDLFANQRFPFLEAHTIELHMSVRPVDVIP